MQWSRKDRASTPAQRGAPRAWAGASLARGAGRSPGNDRGAGPAARSRAGWKGKVAAKNNQTGRVWALPRPRPGSSQGPRERAPSQLCPTTNPVPIAGRRAEIRVIIQRGTAAFHGSPRASAGPQPSSRGLVPSSPAPRGCPGRRRFGPGTPSRPLRPTTAVPRVQPGVPWKGFPPPSPPPNLVPIACCSVELFAEKPPLEYPCPALPRGPATPPRRAFLFQVTPPKRPPRARLGGGGERGEPVSPFSARKAKGNRINSGAVLQNTFEMQRDAGRSLVETRQ
ncbi:hypothetical protein GJAV_G00072780 [Gymnothorax javanicus]|nr:hypothetical protein GJAV_G00072780 [Gymnothorax javanicus]